MTAVIPNYNHGSVISDAIAALTAQNPAPSRIVVVDDGSTDDSRRVLQRLAETQPLLHVVFHERNMGAIGALNTGLAATQTEYVYFGAADDKVQPGLFEALLPLLASAPAIALASTEAIVTDLDTGSSALRPPVLPAFEPAVFSRDDVCALFRNIDNWILTGATIWRTDKLRAAGAFNPALGALADGFVARQLAFRHGSAFAPVPGVEWRLSNSGISRSLASDPDSAEQILSAAMRQMATDPCFPSWYPKLFARRWRFGTARVRLAASPAWRRLVLQVLLTLHYRPTNVLRIIKTMIWRQLRRI
ncbi:glycosyltransferase family 2 protein [Pontivivens ytuae]|uniref:Glycosyltransferase family 2 protein n=1 Tax=Pontivivens ytuae TaxID=2789856 RepID=A0A7S9LP73_9RHOB|nr:glycosyltransferase family A protein [Pontivivens ytuae]QPH52617.1 glycosyltransferase family 2 protein [Pontivivens ytuae]